MLYWSSHNLTRHIHCFIAGLRPKAANTPTVKLDGDDCTDCDEPINVLIAQDHLRELLHLHNELNQHAAIKKEVPTNAEVLLPAAKPIDGHELATKPDNDDQPEIADNKKSNNLKTLIFMAKIKSSMHTHVTKGNLPCVLLSSVEVFYAY